MKNEENTIDFDLSTLSLGELVSLYEKVDSFLQFLEGAMISEENKEEGKK